MSPRGDSVAPTIECQREIDFDNNEDRSMIPYEITRKTNRRVGFRGEDKVVEIPSRDWLTEADQSSMWYSHEEFTKVRQELVTTMELMAVVGKVSENSLCSDGLQTPDEYELRNVVAKEAIQEVLMEQLFQWEDDMFDAEMLADVYFECVGQCQSRATKKGEELAKEVREMHRN
jgi:hypothetical protein